MKLPYFINPPYLYPLPLLFVSFYYCYCKNYCSKMEVKIYTELKKKTKSKIKTTRGYKLGHETKVKNDTIHKGKTIYFYTRIFIYTLLTTTKRCIEGKIMRTVAHFTSSTKFYEKS